MPWYIINLPQQRPRVPVWGVTTYIPEERHQNTDEAAHHQLCYPNTKWRCEALGFPGRGVVRETADHLCYRGPTRNTNRAMCTAVYVCGLDGTCWRVSQATPIHALLLSCSNYLSIWSISVSNNNCCTYPCTLTYIYSWYTLTSLLCDAQETPQPNPRCRAYSR